MAKTISLKASTRQAVGRNSIKSLRHAGNIPGVIYGKRGTQAIQVDGKEFLAALHSAHTENVLVDLTLGEQSRLAFLQDVQHDYLKDTIVHIDLHEISPDEKLHAEVAVVAVGEADGVKNGGGSLDIILRKIKVECLPKDLPDELPVDVSALKIGESIHVRDVPVPAGIEVLSAPDQTVIAVHAPKTEEAAPAATTEAKQPEVLKEKKKEGEAAAAPADKKAAAKK